MRSASPLILATITCLAVGCAHEADRTSGLDAKSWVDADPELVSAYTVDPSTSMIRWSVVQGRSTITGTIPITEGLLGLNAEGSPVKGVFHLDLAQAHVDAEGRRSTAVDSMNMYLRTVDILDIDHGAQASFETHRIIPHPEKRPDEYELIGDLTVKGFSRTISLSAAIAITEGSMKAHSQYRMDRTRWGIRGNSPSYDKDIGDQRVSDLVRISVEMRLTPAVR
ncbi:MAG: YceI family protein [Flavobacteriales bacterium]|nr:YceI family protein [Flavobacteriales bacterium]MCB9166300.1 YceI family protein [Flavobacteriales bacterium]